MGIWAESSIYLPYVMGVIFFVLSNAIILPIESSLHLSNLSLVFTSLILLFVTVLLYYKLKIFFFTENKKDIIQWLERFGYTITNSKQVNSQDSFEYIEGEFQNNVLYTKINITTRREKNQKKTSIFNELWIIPDFSSKFTSTWSFLVNNASEIEGKSNKIIDSSDKGVETKLLKYGNWLHSLRECYPFINEFNLNSTGIEFTASFPYNTWVLYSTIDLFNSTIQFLLNENLITTD